ncbi:hypothetical protein ZWY2020_046352 [Hordeum vulgare]|nr:hypothetical protein ZWY2020_046352 [Hordeum vulgare]
MVMPKRFDLEPLLLTLTCLFCCCSMISSSSQASSAGFLQCVTEANVSVLEQGEGLFNKQLNKYIRNPKFLANTTGKPLYVVMPANAPHVQAAVRCGRDNKMPIRVRSGGHDYEGLSYRSVDAGGFAMLDMSGYAPSSWTTRHQRRGWSRRDARRALPRHIRSE